MSDAGVTGKSFYLKFGSTTLSTNYRSASSNEAMSLIDQSAGSDDYNTYLESLSNGTMSVTAKLAAGDTTTWAAVKPGTEGTLEWGEEGTVAGKPKHTVLAIVESRAKSASYNDLWVVDLAFRFNDPAGPTDGTY